MSLLDFDSPADRYGVMGNPIGHSKSPLIHASFAAQTRQRLSYEAILVEPGGLPQAIGNFHASGGRGLNITVPFKQEAFRLAERLEPRALRAKAVNTLYWSPEGVLVGDNTDGLGLLRDLTHNQHLSLAGRELLLLGAGGAVRGVVEPLLAAAPARLTIANRTRERAEELAQQFADLGTVEACGFEPLQGRRFDLVINGTSASLAGELPPLPAGLIHLDGLAYDMMYAARPTPFMEWARREGVTAVDGLGMLVEQAAESFAIWRGVRPETAPVIQEVRAQLKG